jgi:hypothetical protein
LLAVHGLESCHVRVDDLGHHVEVGGFGPSGDAIDEALADAVGIGEHLLERDIGEGENARVSRYTGATAEGVVGVDGDDVVGR